jgi:Tol biopolymer transport system component
MAADGTGDRDLWSSPPAECSGDLYQPAWNPASTRELAVSCRDAAGNHSLLVVDVDGGVVRELVTPEPVVDDLTFSPDGELITFWASDERSDQGGSLWSVRADGAGAAMQLTDVAPGVDGDPAWSPQGDQVAFRRMADGGSDIFVMARDGSDQVAVTSEPGSESDPTWSPDGRRLAFVSMPSPNDEAELWWMTGTGSEGGQLLSDAPGTLTFSAAWSRR